MLAVSCGVYLPFGTSGMIYMTSIFNDVTVTINTKTNASRADKITQYSGLRLYGAFCSRNPGYLQILKRNVEIQL